MARAEPGAGSDVAVVVGALWRLAAGQPQLLAAHAASYGAMLCDEGAVSLARARRLLALVAVVVVCSTAALVLAGVGLMLWAAAPVSSLRWPWVLGATPLVPLSVAAWAMGTMRRLGPLPLWAAWQQQMAADGALLRQIRRP
jgi:hypothetical protein